MGSHGMSNFAVIDVKSLQVYSAYDVLPDHVIWPNGDATYGMNVGFTHNNEMFVSITSTPPQPNEFYSAGSIALSLQGSVLVQTITWVPMDIVPVKQQLLANLDNTIANNPNLVLALLTNSATTFAAQRTTGITAINSAQTVDTAVVALDTAVIAIANLGTASLATAIVATAIILGT
jgi:hypothetical protein